VEVPFDPVGPGQVGRWAYQVIGRDGPIPNPAGIRYMAEAPPGLGEPANGLGGLVSATGVLGIANVALGAVNLGVSLKTLQVVKETLQVVKRIDRKLDAVLIGLSDQRRQLDEVNRRLARVDINTAEQNLRSALKPALENSVTGEFVDLASLSTIEGDLEKFIESLDDWFYGSNPGLRFSSDIRHMLTCAWRLFYVANAELIARHNCAVNGDPMSIEPHPIKQIMETSADLADGVLARICLDQVFEGAPKELGKLVAKHFFFADGSDKRRYRSWLETRIVEPIRGVLLASNPSMSAMADLLAPYVPEIEEPDDVETAEDFVRSYIEGWLETDAGLLFRLLCEIGLAADSDYWAGLIVDEPRWLTADLETLVASLDGREDSERE